MPIELNITKFVTEHSFDGWPNNDDLMDFSGSRMEHGDDAGRITWDHCVDYVESGEFADVISPDDYDECRDYIRDFGAWDDDEINGWSDTELIALVVQFIAGDLRELVSSDTAIKSRTVDCEAYEEYQAGASSEDMCGRAYRGDDGNWYYFLGN